MESDTFAPIGSFGNALLALKAGERVARAGWNGKGMWLALTTESEVQANSPTLRGAAMHVAVEVVSAGGDFNKSALKVCPHIDMRAADGSLVIGWLASQTDMLAEDWGQLPPLPGL